MKKLIILYTQFYDFEGKVEKIGGIETYIKNLSLVATKLDFEVNIIQFSDVDFQKQYSQNINVYGICDKKKKNVKKLLKKAYQIGNLNEDILLFASSHMNLKNKFNKSLSIQHGIYWDIDKVKGRDFPKTIATILKSLQIFLEIKRNRCVDEVICVDYNYINWYRALTVISDEKLICIPNFTKVEPINKKDNGKSIIFARRFERIRGTELMQEVTKKLISKYPDILITFAGNGTYEKQLKDMFISSNNVNFITYKPEESISVHKEYDIAVVPSIGSEGTSLSLLEAMSAGCCVVATNVGGMTNIIIDHYNGLIISPDAQELFEAIDSLLQDKELRFKLADKGYETVKESFSLEYWQKRWGDILNEK